MSVVPVGSQCNCGYILEGSSQQDDLQGLGLENVHIFLESGKHHCRGSRARTMD